MEFWDMKMGRSDEAPGDEQQETWSKSENRSSVQNTTGEHKKPCEQKNWQHQTINMHNYNQQK